MKLILTADKKWSKKSLTALPHTFFIIQVHKYTIHLVTFKMLDKVVIIGNGGVGKTALVQRFLNKGFPQRYVPTLGVENVTNGQLDIWDTAGQERLRTRRWKTMWTAWSTRPWTTRVTPREILVSSSRNSSTTPTGRTSTVFEIVRNIQVHWFPLRCLLLALT